MRGADVAAGPTLAQLLALPRGRDAAAKRDAQAPGSLPQAVALAWTRCAGGVGVVFAPNVAAARRLLLRACRVAAGEPVLVPANATHGLVEDIKRCGAQPLFGGLDANLALTYEEPVRIAWAQPALGLPCSSHAAAEITVLDHGDTVPALLPDQGDLTWAADVALFGLYLSPDPAHAGALLVFRDAALYAQAVAQASAAPPSLYLRAAKQLARLRCLAQRQAAALTQVAAGLHAAAGLPVLPVWPGAALPHGVLVRIPEEGTPSTFWSFAGAENTPVQWLPQLRPLHHAAVIAHRQSAQHLERWLLVPVSPASTDEENRQAVLGIVKAAEYTGLRWRTDPARAAHYAALLDSMYGPGHDAYRPAFDTSASPSALPPILPDELVLPACRI